MLKHAFLVPKTRSEVSVHTSLRVGNEEDADAHQKESCPDPGVSIDGKREGDCCYIGDVLEFSCNEDYELIGKDKIICLPGAKWSSPRPLCRPLGDYCEVPPIPHGVAERFKSEEGQKEGDYYVPEEEVQVKCEPGYRYNDSEKYIYCEEGNRWERDFKECIEAFCERPRPLKNGRIPEIESSNATLFPHNFDITYICDQGFRLKGDSWAYCASRRWSGTPQCEEVLCPDPGVPEYGTRIGDSFKVGAKVTFKCFMEFELIGSFERYCLPNGRWSGELARCNNPDNYCPNPGSPVNGYKNSSSYNLGDRIEFKCFDKHELIGSKVRECLPSTEWSGQETQCLGRHDFDNSLSVSEILKEAITEKEKEQKKELYEYRKALFSTFHNGSTPMAKRLSLSYTGRYIFYFAFDVSGSVRENNFRESVKFAKAIVKKIGISEHGARAGALTFSSSAKTEFMPLEYKKTDDVLRALDNLQYTGGGTAARSALSQIREELIPLTEKYLSKKGIKSVIFILTDGKSNMGGDPQEQAEMLKQAGVEIYCIGVTNSAEKASLYKIASLPEKEHVFILQDYATLSYLIEEITNGSIDYSKCGLGLENVGTQTHRGRIVGGLRASEPWPWMAAIYFRDPRLSNTLQCGGSIIDKEFILTAAHCLVTKEQMERKPKDIIIKLGLTDIKNQSSLQEFEVEKIHIHPLFPRITDILDYDIALLKLKRPIQFNALVRPICLPPRELPEKSTLYKAGENAIATGWGHSGVVHKFEDVEGVPEDQLKEIVLPIQSMDKCNETIKNNNLRQTVFTERMFCAGDGGGNKDTCKGDSGGPLMQSQMNEKEGHTYWTQIGVISWGIGCGLANTYGYYTHVQKLHDWVISIIQSAE
ncbi:serine protease 42 [Trichonephila inaurata madagascariensis]|uniref:limulus clotting factor C n=1 Tax=Trichonephila inaurata madagascariensis TaxID=2747483 RepID=A0A8X7C6P8_9ARAC|nr:serine protease 42 [Trichonephila inaurata madagascariensis]